MIRLRRDITERGRELEGVLKLYNKFVKPVSFIPLVSTCMYIFLHACTCLYMHVYVIYTCMYMLFIHACTSVVSISGFHLGVGVFVSC